MSTFHRSDLLCSNSVFSISKIALGAVQYVSPIFTKLGSSKGARGAICPRLRCSRSTLDVCTWVTLRSNVGVTVDLSPSHGFFFFNSSTLI